MTTTTSSRSRRGEQFAGRCRVIIREAGFRWDPETGRVTQLGTPLWGGSPMCIGVARDAFRAAEIVLPYVKDNDLVRYLWEKLTAGNW